MLIIFLGLLQCISPQLVVVRVVAGRAWTRDTSTMSRSKLEFTEASRTQIGGFTEENEKSKGLTTSGSQSSSEHIPIGEV